MELGESGPRGHFVTRAVMAAREKDIDSVTILFRSTVELNAPETDTKQKTVTQRVVLVSAILVVVVVWWFSATTVTKINSSHFLT